jgi:site-specific recombinase XerD
VKPMLDPTVETAVRSYRLWLEARGVPRLARVCFTSRLRRYLRWFQSRYRILPLASVVSGQAVYLYREHLYDQGLSAEYIRSLVYPARMYHTWAVETGKLDEPPLPPMFRPPVGRQMKQPKPPYFSVPYVGREKYLEWAVRQGIGPRTLRHYRGSLSSIARWLRDSRGETLGPAHAKPGLLKHYFKATGRSSSSYDSARFALRSYARWAAEEGILKTDPFLSPRQSRINAASA